MTLQEMSVEYRAQAQVLQGRIEALKHTCLLHYFFFFKEALLGPPHTNFI